MASYLAEINRYRPSFPTTCGEAADRLRSLVNTTLTQVRSSLPGERTRFRFAPPELTELSLLEGSMDDERVCRELLSAFDGLPNWSNGRVQTNLMPPTTSVSINAALASALFNPDICSEEFSGNHLLLMEKVVTNTLARLVGYQPEDAAGFFTYGGSFSLQYGIMAGLERVCPERRETGQQQGVKIFTSRAAHFSVEKAAISLGLGAQNVVRIRSDHNGEMDIEALEEELDRNIRMGERAGCVVATLGTTDTFGLDDLSGITAVIDRVTQRNKLDYRIPVHADAAVGWAWSFFNDYDFENNPLQFPPETVRALLKIKQRIRFLNLADSVSLNPHKYGFTPIPSSFIIFRSDITPLINPLLSAFNHYDGMEPAYYTFETTRSPAGVLGTLANFMHFGRTGFQSILGRITEMGLLMREELGKIDKVRIINPDSVGPGTLFCVEPPPGRDRSRFNHQLSGYLEETYPDLLMLSKVQLRDEGWLLKSLVISPFVTPEDIRFICEKLAEAIKKNY